MARRDSTAKPKPEPKPEPREDSGIVAVVDPPPSTLDLAEDDLAAISEEASWLARATEAIFCKLADGTELSEDELATLRRAGPQVVPRDGGRSARAFERWTNTECERIKAVRKLQAQAGSAAERQAASEAADAAEVKYTERSAEIRKAIAKMQAEQADLQAAADAARSVSDRRQKAVAKLREKTVLPSHIADRLQQFKRRWAGGDGHRLETARHRLATLEGLSSLDASERKMVTGGYEGGEDLETVRGYIEGCEAFGGTPHERLRLMGMLREAERPPFGKSVETVPNGLDRGKWSKYLTTEAAAEIESLRSEIEALEREECQALEEMNRLRNYYVPA